MLLYFFYYNTITRLEIISLRECELIDLPIVFMLLNFCLVCFSSSASFSL